MTAPDSVERKCKFEEVFDANFIELLRLVPGNPLLRALLLKLTGKMPAPECATFEQLKNWVETSCEKRARPTASRTTRPAQDDGISIAVEFSDTEYGRVDYSVRRHGSEEFHIGARELMEMVQEVMNDGGGIAEVVELIAGKIEDDAWEQCEPSMDNYGDYNYDDFNANETADSETECSRTEIRDAVLAFVRERHPELAAEL